MDKFERKLFSGYLRHRKAYFTKLTPKEELQEFIKSIRPVTGDYELIRLGSQTDGGYLVPDDLDDITACFSPGTGNETSFEEQCVQKGMDVYLADASVEKPAHLPDNCFFRPNYIGAFDAEKFITLDSWVKSTPVPTEDELMLQMDIEGAEYEVLLSTPQELLNRFKIIVFEVHQLDQWWNAPFFNLASCAFTKLNQTHICVHNHPNTAGGLLQFEGLELPKRIELTFHRRDRVSNSDYKTQYPHPLDCDNTSDQPLVLPEHWYQ